VAAVEDDEVGLVGGDLPHGQQLAARSVAAHRGVDDLDRKPRQRLGQGARELPGEGVARVVGDARSRGLADDEDAEAPVRLRRQELAQRIHRVPGPLAEAGRGDAP
jgi:hypothetical protein